MGSNPLEGEAAAARLSFKLWSEGHGRGGCRGNGGDDGALTVTTATRGNNGEDDQSRTLVGERCCNAGDFTASSFPAFVSFEGKGGAGVTVETAAAAPTSDFGVTATARQLEGGIVGEGGVGSEASVATSAIAPAFIEPDRPVGRLSCTLVQLSTRYACADERRVLIVRVQVLHGLTSAVNVVVGTLEGYGSDVVQSSARYAISLKLAYASDLCRFAIGSV